MNMNPRAKEVFTFIDNMNDYIDNYLSTFNRCVDHSITLGTVDFSDLEENLTHEELEMLLEKNARLHNEMITLAQQLRANEAGILTILKKTR
jgi:hypothetical protein